MGGDGEEIVCWESEVLSTNIIVTCYMVVVVVMRSA
jgi:hypothetical protein